MLKLIRCQDKNLNVLSAKLKKLRQNLLSSFSTSNPAEGIKVSGDLQGEKLNEKGLLRVSGAEVHNFLQGLITNDVNHLNNGRTSIYAAFLNIKGRILYDTIVYKTEASDVLLVECDKSGLSELQKHLKIFKVRRKIDISDVSDEIKIWAIFNKEHSLNTESSLFSQNVTEDETKLDKFLKETFSDADTSVYKDARLSLLGARILTRSLADFTDVLKEKGIDLASDFNYRCLRYKLGVGEGAIELPPGKCFPHEANCDFLHGISFHKGCYIGQELTSRTQHTGVVRKRLMPLKIVGDETIQCEFDAPVLNVEKDKAVGKVRGIEKNYGLGLLRISEALDAKLIKAANVPVSTFKPSWWPVEVPKEKFSLA